MGTKSKRSLVLLSGGMDSTVALYIAKEESDVALAITFDYRQRHHIEIEYAKNIAREANIPHHIISLDPTAFFSTPLVNKELKVNANEALFVPARNTLFLSYALAFAQAHELDWVYFGANKLDYDGYPDCRPQYFTKMNEAFKIAGPKPVEIRLPLLEMSKKDIIKKAKDFQLSLDRTYSCYDPAQNSRHCGNCLACKLRKQGFIESEEKDPTFYDQLHPFS